MSKGRINDFYTQYEELITMYESQKEQIKLLKNKQKKFYN